MYIQRLIADKTYIHHTCLPEINCIRNIVHCAFVSSYIWSTEEDPSEAQKWCNKESNLKDKYHELTAIIYINEKGEAQYWAVTDSAHILLVAINKTSSYVKIFLSNHFHTIKISFSIDSFSYNKNKSAYIHSLRWSRGVVIP